MEQRWGYSLLSLLSWLLGNNNLLGLDNNLVLLWVRKSLSVSGQLEELDTGLSAGVSVLVVGHVGTSGVWRLLLQSLDLAGSVIDGEVLEESLWSLLVDMLDLLWGGVNLLLSLSLTTVKGHVDGADALVLNTAVDDELLVSKGLDTVLELEVLLVALDGGSNLSSIDKRVRKVIKI